MYQDTCPTCAKIKTPVANEQVSKNYLDTVNQALATVFKNTFNNPKKLNVALASIIAKELSQTVLKEYQGITPKWNEPDTQMMQRLTKDVWQFASAKNYQQMRDLTLLLKNDKDELRTFADFKTEAQKVTERYNLDWMRTEYNTAVASSQNAARWIMFQKDKKTIPNLEYQTVGDDAVRSEHQLLDGVVKNIDDAFWDTHYPPNGWGCRCEAVQTLENSTTPANRTADVIVPSLFRTNLAKDSIVFPKGHPYYKDIPKTILTETLKYTPVENAFSSEFYKGKNIYTHALHEANECVNNTLITKKLIDKYKSISKIELLPNTSDLELKKKFYPERWHKNLNVKNADAIVNIDGRDKVVEFKYITGSGKHIRRHIEDASQKSEYAVIMLTEKSILKKEWLKEKIEPWFLDTNKKDFKGLLIIDQNGNELYKKSEVL